MSCDTAHQNIAPTVCRRFSASRSMPWSATLSNNSRMSRRRMSSACRLRIGASALFRRRSISSAVPAADDAPADVKVYQLLDGEPRGRSGSAFLCLGNQVPTGARRAGQVIGTLTRRFEAHISDAPERYSSHLTRTTNNPTS